MIQLMYAPETISSEVESQGIHYQWISQNGEKIGYFAYGPVKRARSCSLHKLYILPAHHGRGFASAALNWLFRRLESAEVHRLDLRVNRENESAIRCYERNGFIKVGEDCLDIGSGYVMDDFLMSRTIPS